MPRNDQVTCQRLLMQKLEQSHEANLQEMAASPSDDSSCHPRTLRRDMEALEAAHIPLVTEQRNGRMCWRLMAGYRQALPLAISPTELVALVFSRDLLQPMEGTEIKASIDSALNKAAVALPAEGSHYFEQIRSYFSVGLSTYKTYRQHKRTVDQFHRAITRTRTVQMYDYTVSRDRISQRKIDPYHLRYMDGGLHLIGHCHVRQEVRMFAVDRIRVLALTNRSYQTPLDFDVDAYAKDALVVMRGKPIKIDLLFDKPTIDWVKGRQWHPSRKTTEREDGRLAMSIRAADTRELVRWVYTSAVACGSSARNRSGEKSVKKSGKFSGNSDPGCPSCLVVSSVSPPFCQSDRVRGKRKAAYGLN